MPWVVKDGNGSVEPQDAVIWVIGLILMYRGASLLPYLAYKALSSSAREAVVEAVVGDGICWVVIAAGVGYLLYIFLRRWE